MGSHSIWKGDIESHCTPFSKDMDTLVADTAKKIHQNSRHCLEKNYQHNQIILLRTLRCPHLEYWMPFWPLHLRK